MKDESYIMFGTTVVGRMPDDTVKLFDTVFAYKKAYAEEKKKLEDEMIDEMFRLENEFRVDDLHNDFVYA